MIIVSPNAIPCLSKYFKNEAVLSATFSTFTFLPISTAASTLLLMMGIFPFLSGIGSPCGSKLGLPKKIPNSFNSLSDCICSNCSATSCTSAHVKFRCSTKKVSQSRCLRITLTAAFNPSFVNFTPLARSYEISFFSSSLRSISVTEAGLIVSFSAISWFPTLPSVLVVAEKIALR